MKFTPEQRKLIKETRIKIKKLEDEQSALYTNLIKEIKMNPTAEEWMFDYLYNSFGTIKKIESLIK